MLTVAILCEIANQAKASPAWNSTGSLAVGSFGSTATVLIGGDVLVAGGMNSSGDLRHLRILQSEH